MTTPDQILTELAKAVEKMTAAPWIGVSTPSGRHYGIVGKPGPGNCLAVLSGVPARQRHPDTQGIVALRNHAQALIEIAQAAAKWQDAEQRLGARQSINVAPLLHDRRIAIHELIDALDHLAALEGGQ